jgi:Uma2 family endonuclease
LESCARFFAHKLVQKRWLERLRPGLFRLVPAARGREKDRAKAAVYASAGIGEYWIVNLGARAVEVYLSPDGDKYAEVRTLRTGDVLRPVALPDIAITVAEILPEA